MDGRQGRGRLHPARWRARRSRAIAERCRLPSRFARPVAASAAWSTKRRSTEEGHRRKFLVVIDDTPECSRALLYRRPPRRAHRRRPRPPLRHRARANSQQWVGVENIMRAEAMEEAEETLGRYADIAREREQRRAASWSSARAARRGDPQADRDDEDIAILVLAAGTDKEGPGPAGHGARRQGRRHLPDPDHHRPRPSRRRGDRGDRLSAVAALDVGARRGLNLLAISEPSSRPLKGECRCSSRPKPRPIRPR